MSVQADDLKTAVEHAVRNLRCAVRNLRKHYAGQTVEYPEILIDHPIVHLEDHLLANARCYASRESLLDNLGLSFGGVCVEIGTSTGAFAERILGAARPERLDLVDLDFSRLKPSIAATPCVRQHKMNSATFLEKTPDRTYDFMYVDADHSYRAVTAEMRHVKRVVKPGALVMFNDYTRWSITQVLPYGVMSAVNAFAVETQSSVVGVALTGTGHFDICLRVG